MTTSSNRYRKQYQLDRLRGIQRTVAADAAREHAQRIMAETGVSLRGFAEAAGVGPTGLHHILYAGTKRIRATTATKILQTTFDDVMDRSNRLGFVPNIGARRRIQGLLALGWRHQDIAAVMGTGTNSRLVLHQIGEWITRDTHEAVKRAFAELSASRGPSERTRGRARALGYLPPLAWDDEVIDDPNGSPYTGSAADGGDDIDDNAVLRACRGDLSVSLNRAELQEAFERLAARRLSHGRIADILGVSERSVVRWANGHTTPYSRPAHQEAS